MEDDLKESKELEVYYFRFTDLWKNLCEEHNILLDQTCEEYSLLLSSDMDLLEQKVQEKEETIKRINQLEKLRSTAIKELSNSSLVTAPINNITELINIMAPFEQRNEGRHLFRFNAFLIDIIEKIQAQNKKNHLFINKALANLKKIREEALGIKSYSTYDKSGGTQNYGVSQG